MESYKTNNCCCPVLCCYKEPDLPMTCGKKVKKNGNIVRCKREGKEFSSKTGQWFCKKHFEEVETLINVYINDQITKSPKRVSTDGTYSTDSADSY